MLLVATLFVTESAAAQATTSAIAGRIETKSGSPLAGATVVATHTPSGTRYGAIADVDGSYRIEGMRVGGPYSVEMSFVGCTSVRYDNLTLELGHTRRLDAALDESQSLDAVTVSIDAFDASRAGAADNFNTELIGSMPTVSRSLYDIARLSPQVMPAKDGGVSIAGTNSRYNSFQIDGIVSNDIYGLTSSGTNGGLTDANPLPLDAIDEIQIVTAPFDVRQSGFTGGGINAVTKSGTNTFRGTAYAYYNNQDFYGKGTSGDKLSRQSTQIYGLSLGGAIVKDKLFFFAIGEFDYDSSPSSFYPGYAGSKLSAAQAQAVADRYEALTGYNGGGFGRRNVVKRSGSALARLDWNISDRHKLTLRYNYLNARKDEYSNNAGAFYFNGSGYAGVSETHSVVGELNSRASQTVFNTLRIGYSHVTDGRDNEVELPYVTISKIDAATPVSVNIGTDPFSGRNGLVQNSVSISDDLSIYLRDHTFTVGTHNEIYTADNLFLSNAFGAYTYETLADFQAGTPSRYAYNKAAGEDPTIHMKTAQFGVYVQDEWQLTRDLMLSYGLRADIPVIFGSPVENPAFNASDIAAKYGVRVGDKPNTKILLSPRIGFRWTAYDDGHSSTLLRGGVGLFTGKVPFVWITNCYSNTGMSQIGYSIKDASQIPPFGSAPDASVGATSNPVINVVDPDFSYPQTLRANLALEQTLRGGWHITVEGIFSKVYNDLLVRNLVAQDNGYKLHAVGADNATTGNTTVYYDSSAQKHYSSVCYLTNNDKGYSYSVSASVRKHFRFGLDVAAAYTFGHAYTLMDGMSSQAASLWGKNCNIESNSPALSWSLFDVPHKVTASVSYSKRYGGLFGTSVSLVYQAYSGMRYTPTYYKNRVDVNGDSYDGNSSIYIPTDAELAKMDFADASDREKFAAYIESDRYLRSHRGEYAKRNCMQLPFEHHLDLHFAQDFYFGRTSSRKLQITVDVVNFGNMLCRDWGASYYLSGWKLSPVTVTSLAKDDDRKSVTPTYSFNGADISQNDLLSRWHLQVGARVVF